MAEIAVTSPDGPSEVTVATPRWGRRIAWLLMAVAIALGVKFLMHLLLPRNFKASGEALPLVLPSGAFSTPYYCDSPSPKGVIILGTGDGGWSYWEENTAKHLAQRGYAVGGWDCRRFADTRSYGHDDLVAGFRAAVVAVEARAGVSDVPVWYGGWSTGAEQSVAAAASRERPARLVGLLLVAPGRRGRYGITTSDLLGVEPSGPGSFALADLAPELGDEVRVVQFAAGLDPLDDVDWIASVPGPHRVIDLPGKLHDMGGAGEEFLQLLDEGIQWTLTAAAGANLIGDTSASETTKIQYWLSARWIPRRRAIRVYVTIKAFQLLCHCDDEGRRRGRHVVRLARVVHQVVQREAPSRAVRDEFPRSIA